ncbi:uncharacterized protein LOC106086293 [Stomoxys calcitrans]|uniref:uncharacterized protein LOC106086293 n=1 Tax=Stomoxys calcitrans TaxID=35570 RepID=UPI0027E2AEBA|nr:uncharacterized protein LOC106086293 [Stomoxys calcitrans]
MAQRTVTFARNCCCCIFIILFVQHVTPSLATDVAESNVAENTTLTENNETEGQPIAEALVRYRRHPPRTIIKHIIRPKRIKVKRIKRPKIKYHFAEPPPTKHYRKSKPTLYSYTPSLESSLFEGFSHVNVESTNFDLPPSSYEAQSMDLDLYKTYESPSSDDSYHIESDKPTFSYTAPEISYSEPSYSSTKGERKPHSKYGVPKDVSFSTGYDKPSSGSSYSYHDNEEILVDKPYKSSHGGGYSYQAPTHSHESFKNFEHSSSYETSHDVGGYQEEHPPQSYEEVHPQEIKEKPTSFYSGGSGSHEFSYQPEEHSHSSYSSSSSSEGHGSFHGQAYLPPSQESTKAQEIGFSSYSSSSGGHGGSLGYSYEAPAHKPAIAEGGHESGPGYSYHPPAHESSKPIARPSSYSSNSGGHGGSLGYSYEPPVHKPAIAEGGHESGPGYSYHAPAHESSKPITRPSSSYTEPAKVEHNSYAATPQQHSKHPRIPATKYGVPDLHLPVANFGDGDYNKYSLVEQKAPPTSFSSKKHHFAEPPEPHKPTVEITFSPSYEIKLPPSGDGGHYQHEEPPQEYDHNHSPPSGYHHQQESSDTHQPAKYEPAPAQDLPIEPNHKHPNYDFPKTSYEVPIYDPIPFDSSNNQEQEIYPPQPFENVAWQENSQMDYTAEPNNVAPQKPQITEDTRYNEPDEMPHGDVHSSGTRFQGHSATATLPQRVRKRKRNKGTTAATTSKVSTKHILDVPELTEAFERDKHKYENTNTDADINESHKVVKVNHGPWNPLRIRTPAATTTTTPTTTLSLDQTPTKNIRIRYQGRTRPSSTTVTTEAPSPQQSNHIPHVEIVSIEKSRSKSYYDGILSTPKIYNPNLYRNRYKTTKQQSGSTAQPPSSSQVNVSASPSSNTEKFSKRTTKNIFDTTVFKSPLTDRGVHQNLPKNHKLF